MKMHAEFFFHVCVQATVRYFYMTGKRFLAGPEDAFWFVEKYASSSASIGLYIIKGPCNMPVITERMTQAVYSPLVGNKLRLRFINFLNVVCWELFEDFSIKEHIKVENPGKEHPITESKLFRLMQEFQDTPLDSKRPPWEMIIIPHYSYQSNGTEDPHYAVIFRVHHGVMDGISTGNILHSILADKPFQFSVDPCFPFGHKRRSWAKKLVDKVFMAGYYFISALCLPRTGLRHLVSFDNMHRPYFKVIASLKKKFVNLL